MSFSERVCRIAVLASGRGSNFRAVLEARAAGQIQNSECIALFADRKDTGAARLAREHSIDVVELDFASYSNRAEYDQVLHTRLQEYAPDLVLALGYMRILDRELVRSLAGKLINIHPALLPAFPGMHAQRQAVEYGVRVAGATVHFVDEGVDTGPIILQKAIEINPFDDLVRVEQAILRLEHRLIVEATDLYCSGRLQIDGRRVRILPSLQQS